MGSAGWSEEMATSDTMTLGGLTMGGNIAMGTNLITGLGTPTAATDAATKGYVDSVASGIDIRASVRAASVAADLTSFTPSGTGVGKTLTAPDDATAHNTWDTSVVLVLNDRVLVKSVGGENSSNLSNGIYTVTQVGNGAGQSLVLTRAVDADQDAEVTAGMFVFVEEGTLNADSGWVLQTNNPITVDTTALQFVQFSQAGVILGGAGLTKSSATLDVELDTGADAQGVGSNGGNSGLEFDTTGVAGKLRVRVNGSGGIQRGSSGLELELATVNTLTVGASGLDVAGVPSLFKIAGTAVGANVTAVNLDALTGGGATALHSHAGAGTAQNVARTQVVSEAIAAADPLYQTGTNNQMGKARADTDAKSYVLGVATTVQGTPGGTTTLVMHGSCAGILSGATAGTRYFLGDTGGIATALPSAGYRVIEVGVAENASDLFVRIVDLGKKAA
jgi:hypothetical protein